MTRSKKTTIKGTRGRNGSRKRSVSRLRSALRARSRSKSRPRSGLAERMSRPRVRGPGMRGALPQVSAAAAYSSGQSTGPAQVFRDSADRCRVVHRELVGSVVGSTAFAVSFSLAINPGLSATFPWLSVMASAWERYKFNSLRFCYYTRTGSTTPGSIMLAPDYDPADGAPSTEFIASSYEDTQEDAPWKDIVVRLNHKSLLGGMNDKYIRTTALVANQDIKTYDSGNLFVCTVDGNNAANWGKLWVEYDIDFYTPQLSPAPSGIASTLFNNMGTSQSNLFGTAGSAAYTGNFGLSASSANVLRLSNLTLGQELYVTVIAQGASPSVLSATLVGLSVSTALASSAIGGGSIVWAATVLVADITATITMTGSATSIADCYVIVTPLVPQPIF